MNSTDYPGLYQYSLKVDQYKKLDDEQYVKTIAALQSELETERASAREQLICSHLGMVFRLAQKISWRYKLDLSECVGLGNFTLVERFDKFDPERGRFFTYMRKIVAYRMLRDQFDYYSRARDYDAAIDDVAQEYQEIDLQGKYVGLHAALRQLNKEESEIIYLLFFTPMRYSEESVAECLGRTVRGLKESKAAILAKLRDIMGSRDYFPEKQYAIIK